MSRVPLYTQWCFRVVLHCWAFILLIIAWLESDFVLPLSEDLRKVMQLRLQNGFWLWDWNPTALSCHWLRWGAHLVGKRSGLAGRHLPGLWSSRAVQAVEGQDRALPHSGVGNSSVAAWWAVKAFCEHPHVTAAFSEPAKEWGKLARCSSSFLAQRWEGVKERTTFWLLR